jgi:hypothetical protein
MRCREEKRQHHPGLGAGEGEYDNTHHSMQFGMGTIVFATKVKNAIVKLGRRKLPAVLENSA